ncbi:protein of unknown function [Sterolibacterium denitrificans]|uniref:Uncharacterized protein n=2 Tax=Sterolibacterium denitrificans TaxID=157592 RepID=A0A7Z7HS59_9PROT|nr:hypothetical protein [Sterolibacterium denitrificans]KYC29122.1 hypothetical protein ACY05_00640 [Sterolibacterium denitrificans]SMB29084.1 protein of unknown function [Sterolibacterium denitrificans]
MKIGRAPWPVVCGILLALSGWMSKEALALPGAAVSVPPLVDVAEPEPVSAPPKAPPVMLLYNPLREPELPIFTGAAQRFIQSARPLRPRFNAMPSREKVNFLERYVFAMCNSRLVNGMDMVFKMETGSENFCGYMPGMLSCFAADSCSEPAYAEAVKYIRGSLAKFDRFIKWSDRRKWQYRGDALKVAFYTRNTLTKRGQLCATLKLLNDNDEAVVVRAAARLRTADGGRHTVFSRPYYVAARSSLPNLSDEDLFSKDTEMRMRKLTADAQAVAKQAGIADIQAYTGTHERWNCVASASEALPQAEFSQVWVEFSR